MSLGDCIFTFLIGILIGFFIGCFILMNYGYSGPNLCKKQFDGQFIEGKCYYKSEAPVLIEPRKEMGK